MKNKLEKFPVYGLEGKKYMVKLDIGEENVIVYLYEQTSSIFGKPTFRKLNAESVAHVGVLPLPYQASGHAYKWNMIEIVKNAVKLYEREKKKNNKEKELLEEQAQALMDWNGEVKW